MVDVVRNRSRIPWCVHTPNLAGVRVKPWSPWSGAGLSTLIPPTHRYNTQQFHLSSRAVCTQNSTARDMVAGSLTGLYTYIALWVIVVDVLLLLSLAIHRY
jgi:hypothetical protein